MESAGELKNCHEVFNEVSTKRLGGNFPQCYALKTRTIKWSYIDLLVLTAPTVLVSGFELYSVYSEYTVYFWFVIRCNAWLKYIYVFVILKLKRTPLNDKEYIELSANTPHLWGLLPRKPLLNHSNLHESFFLKKILQPEEQMYLNFRDYTVFAFRSHIIYSLFFKAYASNTVS